MLQRSSLTGPPAATAPRDGGMLRPAVDITDPVGADPSQPRLLVWSDPLRQLAVELQRAQDGLDPAADDGAWVVPL